MYKLRKFNNRISKNTQTHYYNISISTHTNKYTICNSKNLRSMIIVYNKNNRISYRIEDTITKYKKNHHRKLVDNKLIINDERILLTIVDNGILIHRSDYSDLTKIIIITMESEVIHF